MQTSMHRTLCLKVSTGSYWCSCSFSSMRKPISQYVFINLICFSLAFGSLLSEFMCRVAEWSFVHFKVQSFSVSPQQFFLEAFQKSFILTFHAWLSARYFSGKRKRFLRLLAHINDRILTSKSIVWFAHWLKNFGVKVIGHEKVGGDYTGDCLLGKFEKLVSIDNNGTHPRVNPSMNQFPSLDGKFHRITQIHHLQPLK